MNPFRDWESWPWAKTGPYRQRQCAECLVITHEFRLRRAKGKGWVHANCQDLSMTVAELLFVREHPPGLSSWRKRQKPASSEGAK